MTEDGSPMGMKNDTAEVRSPAASFSASPIPNVTNGDKSMNENITPAAQPATISEQELWTLFADWTVDRSLKVGGIEISLLSDGRTFNDTIRSHSDYCELEYFTDQLAETIGDAYDPLWTIETALNDIEAYAVDLKRVRDSFESLKTHLVVYPEDDDGDAEKYRYRHPGIASRPAPVTLEAVEEAVGSLEGSGINLSDDPAELLKLVGNDETVANLRHLADLLDKREAA